MFDKHHNLVKELGRKSDVILFTDKLMVDGIGEEEMDFIKEIFGYNGDGLLFVGIRKPQEVEGAFYKIHSFCNQNISLLQSKVL